MCRQLLQQQPRVMVVLAAIATLGLVSAAPASARGSQLASRVLGSQPVRKLLSETSTVLKDPLITDWPGHLNDLAAATVQVVSPSASYWVTYPFFRLVTACLSL